MRLYYFFCVNLPAADGARTIVDARTRAGMMVVVWDDRARRRHDDRGRRRRDNHWCGLRDDDGLRDNGCCRCYNYWRRFRYDDGLLDDWRRLRDNNRLCNNRRGGDNRWLGDDGWRGIDDDWGWWLDGFSDVGEGVYDIEYCVEAAVMVIAAMMMGVKVVTSQQKCGNGETDDGVACVLHVFLLFVGLGSSFTFSCFPFSPNQYGENCLFSNFS